MTNSVNDIIHAAAVVQQVAAIDYTLIGVFKYRNAQFTDQLTNMLSDHIGREPNGNIVINDLVQMRSIAWSIRQQIVDSLFESRKRLVQQISDIVEFPPAPVWSSYSEEEAA